MLQYLSKYKYPATITFFLAWMLFFDSNSVVYMYKQYSQHKELQAQQAYLQEEIDAMRRQKEELFSSDERLEKFAREQYFFKRPDEDIYVVE